MTPGGWHIEMRAGVRHVLPNTDAIKHETGTGGCTCGTERIKPKAGLPVVLHSTICPVAPPVAGIPDDYE